MKDFSGSIKIDTSQWDVYFQRGIILYLNGDFRNAEKDFRKAAGMTSNAEVRTWLFFSEYKSRGWSSAAKNLKLYAGMGSENEDWFSVVKYLLEELSEDRLLREIRPVNMTGSRKNDKERLAEATSDTYFAVGLKYYATGSQVGAKKYLEKCVQTKAYGVVSFDVARAMLSYKWSN